MNFISFQQAFQERDVIPVNDILKRFPDFDTRRLVEWQDKGYLEKIINKFYSWAGRPVSENRLFFTANRLCHNSYISLWSALRWYGFIPEGVYQIFSVTTKQTHHFETPLGYFYYQHVKPDLFFGYRPVQAGQREFLIAEPEKALLDTFYLSPELRDGLDIDGLRLNIEIIAECCNADRLALYTKAYRNKRVEKLSSLITQQLTIG